MWCSTSIQDAVAVVGEQLATIRSDPQRYDSIRSDLPPPYKAAYGGAVSTLYGHSTDISNIYYVLFFVFSACVFGELFQPAAAL